MMLKVGLGVSSHFAMDRMRVLCGCGRASNHSMRSPGAGQQETSSYTALMNCFNPLPETGLVMSEDLTFGRVPRIQVLTVEGLFSLATQMGNPIRSCGSKGTPQLLKKGRELPFPEEEKFPRDPGRAT